MLTSSPSRGRVDLTLTVFVTGVVVASLYAARPAPAVHAGDTGRVSPSARVLSWARVAGGPFALGIGLMVIGAWLGRARRRQRLTTVPHPDGPAATGRGASDLRSEDPVALARELLAGSAGRIGQLRGAPLERDAARWCTKLDELLEQDVPALLELGPALAVCLGAVRYAELMGACAGCERNAARAWSALTDGAFGEVPSCLERAATSLAYARTLLSPESGDGARPGKEAS